MELYEAMLTRHSVRRYLDKQIEIEKKNEIKKLVASVNEQSGLNIQVFFDEPNAFRGNKPSYGAFKGCKNYFALVGGKDKQEEIGYYGELLVLEAQRMGLNTCWVALTYHKGSVDVTINEGEKLHMVISLGYGETQGFAHKDKKRSTLCTDGPDWFQRGMDAVMLAPTAINQQKFFFTYLGGNKVSAKAKFGVHAKTDLGIVKYHFEIGAGKENFVWEEV